jgi:hypothetical protein
MEPHASDRYATVMNMLLDWGFDPGKDKIDLSAAPVNEMNPELMKKINEPIYDADTGDETLVNLQVGEERKKERKRRLATLAAAVLGAAIILYLFGTNRIENPPATSPVAETEQLASQVFPVRTIAEPAPPEAEETPPADPGKEKYDRALNNAIEAFNAQNYEKAAKFIAEAEAQMVTGDTKKYKQLCRSELEKIEIQKRKNLYDFFVEFGNFAVVKKKTSGLYGTIDDNGFEIVKCIYVSTQPSGNNRLFQRSDDLFDLYNPEGKLLAEGVTGFE